MAVVASLQGCFLTDIADDGCPSADSFQPTNVSGVWKGTILDAIPVQFELVQLSPVISLGDPAELGGTVSITLGGGVEASGPVTGDTSFATCGSDGEPSKQYVGLDAVLSVMPDDNLDLDVTLDFVGSFGGGISAGPGDVEGPLRYSGPTSFTFGPDGEVVGFELDTFSEVFFTLTREQR
ncbi:MAG: hypothetical protein OXF01_00510 [Gemmatimonadetes bacterium]|nr:hypothetical protein [Gemmatimonadota bacterium]